MHTGCHTEKGEKLSSSQADPGKAIKSAVAYFPLRFLCDILSGRPVLLRNILCHPGIPNYDGEVPEREVRAEYPFGYTVKPNDTITSGKREQKIDNFKVACHALPKSRFGDI